MTICFLTGAGNSGPSIAGVIFVASASASFSAIGFWAGVHTTWLSLILQILAFAATTGALKGLEGRPNVDELPILVLFGAIIVAIVAGPLLLFRFLRNGKLIRVQFHGENEFGYRETIQFSLVHLFILTTATAVAIPVIQWFAKLLSQSGDPGALGTVSKLGITLALANILSVWATLGRRAIIRTAMVLPIVILLSALNYYFIRTGRFQWVYSSILIVTWLQLIVLLWCLRASGYRFVSLARNAVTASE